MITTLQFEGKAIHVFPREKVAAALKRNHFDIALNCGGKNRCGGCRIVLLSGTFISEGKVFTVSEDAPVEVNSCTLEMLTNGTGEYPKHRSCLSAAPAEEVFLPEIPENFPATLIMDLGTTNIEALLIENGISCSASRINRQSLYGDNVIDRIAFASTDENKEILRQALIRESIQPLIFTLTAEPEKIRQIIVAGNTAMTHFFFNADPSPLGKSPFQPEQLEFTSTAGDSGLEKIAPSVPVKALPCLGGFIGGDITAGAAFAGFGNPKFCELYMDIGTNCEILLNKNGEFFAVSAAAGPAFERNNLRADNTCAVKHLFFKDDAWQFQPQLDTPEGFCGTALVDLLAEGRKHAFLDQFAQWVKEPELPEKLLIPNAKLAELLTAKAAIESAWQLLLRKAGINSSNINKIYLAGNFSEKLNISNAKYIRLLPDLPDQDFILCGNAALKGSVAFSMDPGIENKIRQLQKKSSLINPAEEPDYLHLFASAMRI